MENADYTPISVFERKDKPFDIDDVLSKLGKGKYQFINLILIGLVIGFSSISPVSFTLTASDLNYRCKIDGCDVAPNITYDTPWLSNAVPYSESHVSKCSKFHHNKVEGNTDDCSSEGFNKSITEPCNDWIFETNERTILNEFNITCKENAWKLTSVGTINNIAQFIGIPLSGFLSDRFGRKTVMVLSVCISSVFGILRAVSVNYIMFVVFEFWDSLFSSGVYPVAFVLALELVTPKYRPMAGTVIGIFYPFGAVILGIMAWFFMDWRKTILSCYVPSLIFIFYWWTIPESVRWLQMKGYHQEVIKTLKSISKANQVKLPDDVFMNIKLSINNGEAECKSSGFWEALKTSLRRKVILQRMLVCSFCWFATTMAYYGLSFNAIDLAGNKFLNFIMVNLVEVPAFVFSGMIMKRIKRRPSQSFSFILGGLGCIVCQMVPTGFGVLKAVIYMISKFWITVALNILYVFSAEIYPTELRLSLVGLCSMFGRFGSMVAPQTPLLRIYFGENAPVFLFGGITLIAGVLSSFFPETFKAKLQDRVSETA